MKRLETLELDRGYSLSIVDKIEEVAFMKLFKEGMGNYPELPWRDHQSSLEKESDKGLQSNVDSRFQIRVVIEKDNQIVAYSFGFQESIDPVSFYMAISVVDKEHRRKGLYGKMFQFMKLKAETEGFHSIHSRHIVANNPIIIAKLKLGFTISGMEINPSLGQLLHLNYHFNPLKKRAASFRAGALKDKELYELFLS